MVAAESGEGVAKIARDLFRALHRLPSFGKTLFLSGLRRKRFKLGMGVPQIVGIRLRFRNAGFFLLLRA